MIRAMWLCTGDEALGDRSVGCVVVPTMGALHAGHAALVARAAGVARERGLAAGAVVSVFVNPTQFDDPSDYERYARTLDADAALCRASGASGVWAPSVAAMYPPEGGVAVPALPGPAVEKGLEDAHRPGHFEGVCQVVRRLFDVVRPVAAVFGEKDWQQLQVVRAMSARDGLGVEIVPGETVREADGLAMSSRNRFLVGAEREGALVLRRALEAAGRERTPEAAEAAMRGVYAAAGVRPDYAAVRDAETLGAWRPGRPGRAITAARVGTVRLLDNEAWVGGR